MVGRTEGRASGLRFCTHYDSRRSVSGPERETWLEGQAEVACDLKSSDSPSSTLLPPPVLLLYSSNEI